MSIFFYTDSSSIFGAKDNLFWIRKLYGKPTPGTDKTVLLMAGFIKSAFSKYLEQKLHHVLMMLGVERGNGDLCVCMTLGFRGAVMNYSGIDPFWQIRGPPLQKLKHYRAHRGLIWIKKFKKIIWGLCTYGIQNLWFGQKL